MLPDDPYIDSDQWLVEQARQGNQWAADRLFAKHYEAIYWYLLLHWHFSQEDARDLSQEIFIKAWRGLPGLRQNLYFASWLRGIALNAARDEWRKRERHIQPSPLDADFDVIDGNSSPEEQVIAMDRFVSALKNLPELRQTCLCLFYRDGLKPQAIALKLNLTEGTVRSYISQARKDLLAALSGQQIHSPSMSGGKKSCR
jgi:RNA polymerase sigma-70 factor (ECF subfamily)